jgi:Flp pilus assembly protein TadG
MKAGGERGQSATETMIMMSFLFLMIFAIVHMAMLASTKFMVNYAAFAAARAAVVAGSERLAAIQVTDNLRWWRNPLLNLPNVRRTTRTIAGVRRPGVEVTARVPFGLPIFNSVPTGGIRVVGFAPVAVQPGVPIRGDNR